MQTAIKNGVSINASISGEIAQCKLCGNSVRAYIKKLRNISHWKHINSEMCDKWWENELEWHINWKNIFPEEWREFVMRDESTGEKHIADIYTKDRLKKIVLEFQNSSISIEEAKSREMFYKDMIWIFNGISYKFSTISKESIMSVRNELNVLIKELEDVQNEINNEKLNAKILYDKAFNQPFPENDPDKLKEIMELRSEYFYETNDHLDNDDNEEIEELKSLNEKIRVKEKMIKILESPEGTFRFDIKARKLFDSLEAPIFIDMGEQLFLINKSEKYVTSYDKDRFVKHYSNLG